MHNIHFLFLTLKTERNMKVKLVIIVKLLNIT